MIQDRTKTMFAVELEKMLAEVPMEKIRITSLCKRCGTSPQLFYYHFKDKYELVAWIFLHDFAISFGDREAEYSAYSLQRIMVLMKSRSIFYKKALIDSSQNSVGRYIHDFNLELAQKAYANANDGQALSQKQIMMVKHHSYGTLGLFLEWLSDRNTISAEQWAEFQYEQTPEFLKQAFAKYSYSTDEIMNSIRQSW